MSSFINYQRWIDKASVESTFQKPEPEFKDRSRLQTLALGLYREWIPREIVRHIVRRDAVSTIERFWLRVRHKIQIKIDLSNNHATLNLQNFHPRQMKQQHTTLIIGKRSTGKSWLIKDLLYKTRRHYNLALINSPTETYDQNYHGVTPDLFIHSDLDADFLQNVVDCQKMITQRGLNSQPGTNTALILDDALNDNRTIRDQNFRFLMMNNRHIKTSLFMTQQHPLGLSPSLRTNVDYVFIGRETNMSNRRKLYDHYAGIFPNFQIFCQVLDICTQNYGFLVIDNTVFSSRIEDNVFWYQASNHNPTFQIGNSNGTIFDQIAK